MRSFHEMASLLYLKSCKMIISATSAPTQAYLSLAGFENARKGFSKGFNINVLAQFPGPMSITFWKLRRPFIIGSLRAEAYTYGSI